MSCFTVYVTASNKEEAENISLNLVESRLAACVNILPGVKSIYRWQGKVETAMEVVMLVKTQENQLQELISKIKELHSYECPCITAYKIDNGFQPYLDWIIAQTD